MAERHDGGVGGTRLRISDAHYGAESSNPSVAVPATAPLTQGSYGAARDLGAVK